MPPIDHPNGPEPDLPPWFSNEDEDPIAPEPDDGGIRQTLIVAAAVLVIVILLLIPVLQATLLQRNQDSLPDNAYQRTALQFTSAVYFARSTGQAQLFASGDASDDIENVVSYFRDQPPNSNLARVQVSTAPCPRERDDADLCFLGRLFDTNTRFTPAILFGLAERDGKPEVIFAQLDQTTVMAPQVSLS